VHFEDIASAVLIVQLLDRYAATDEPSVPMFQPVHLLAKHRLDGRRGLKIVKGDFERSIHDCRYIRSSFRHRRAIPREAPSQRMRPRHPGRQSRLGVGARSA